MKRLNGVFSTTLQWNPGDEFIFHGIQSFETCPTNWVAYNRNPDLWNSPRGGDYRPRPTQWGNNWHWDQHSLGDFDFVLFAGSPSWTGMEVEPLVRHALSEGKPSFYLGVGRGGTAHKKYHTGNDAALVRQACLVTCRDLSAAKEVRMMGREPDLVGPCPALFSSPVVERKVEKRKLGWVIQFFRGNQIQQVDQGTEKGILQAYTEISATGEYESTLAVHYAGELVELLKRGYEDVFYSYSSLEYAEMYNSFDLVISTRLHGAVLALSAGTPSILVNPSFRAIAAAERIPCLIQSTPSNLLKTIRDVNIKEQSEKIIEFRQNKQVELEQLLRGVSGEHPWRAP